MEYADYLQIESSQRQHNESLRREDERCQQYELHALRVAKELCGTPKQDGDMWCLLYGDNLQEGVAGFGKTITQAALVFVDELNKKIAPEGEVKLVIDL